MRPSLGFAVCIALLVGVPAVQAQLVGAGFKASFVATTALTAAANGRAGGGSTSSPAKGKFNRTGHASLRVLDVLLECPRYGRTESNK